jgi:hypothetical protein
MELLGCLIEPMLWFLAWTVWEEDRGARPGGIVAWVCALGLAAVLVLRGVSPDPAIPYTALIVLCSVGIAAGVAWAVVSWWRE